VDARLVPFLHGPEQTLRMIITPHYGGSVVRVRLTNRFGIAPVTFHDVAIAHSESGAALVADSSRPVLFEGKRSVTVSAGRDVVSDPVAFTVQAFDNLAVSLYPDGVLLPTEHFAGRQVSYGTLSGAGDHVADPTGLAFVQTTTARYFVHGLDVRAGGDAGTVVTFGDSLTDGYQSGPTGIPETISTLNINARYPDWLARRLLAEHIPLSVANAGIYGNQILRNGSLPFSGPSGLSRFRADVIDQPGVRTVLILLGTNDIGTGNATPAQIISGLEQLIAMARDAHLRVLLGTLTPMKNATSPTYAGAGPNATREAVNAWIRTQHVADGYIDFARAVGDPSNPDIIAPEYDGGDGLHFSPAGYRAMANAVPLDALCGPVCARQTAP
jgi:lysophospholipase L1-like esterase